MKNPYRKPAPLSFVVGVFVGALLLGVFADSTTRTAFAHGIINAFGIEYDNQVSGLVAADVQAAIDEQDATIAAFENRISALESSPCNPDGDEVITPQEMWDYLDSLGVLTTEDVISIGQAIGNMESGLPDSNRNGIIDSPIELNEFNRLIIGAYGVPPCFVQ